MVKYIKSDRIWTPYEYLNEVVGNDYFLKGANQLNDMERILEEKGLSSILSYAFNEIDEIIENKINVVLVEGTVRNMDTGVSRTGLRWFELPT